MPIANINKIYYGETEITKVMYGDVVVYESTPPITWEYELYNHDVDYNNDGSVKNINNPFYYNSRHMFMSFEFTDLYRTNSGYDTPLSNGIREYTQRYNGSFGIVRKPNSSAFALFLYDNYPIIFDDGTDEIIPSAPTGTDANIYRFELERKVNGNTANIKIKIFINGEIYKELDRNITIVNAPTDNLIVGGGWSFNQNRAVALSTCHINHFKIGYMD